VFSFVRYAEMKKAIQEQGNLVGSSCFRIDICVGKVEGGLPYNVFTSGAHWNYIGDKSSKDDLLH
jgi:hypothetical protein